MARMAEICAHDAGVLSRLAQFYRLPESRRQEIFDELESPDGKQVGAVILSRVKPEDVPEPIRLTAELYQNWVRNNIERGRIRRKARMQRRRGVPRLPASIGPQQPTPISPQY